MLALASTVAVSLFAVAMILLMLERRRRPATAAADKAEALDTIEAWPPQAVRVLTLEERHAYEIVRRALPKHLVLAQVPLARFISVPTQHSYAEWLQRAGRLSVDLLITDTSSRPVAAIEIRAAEENPRSEKRHKRLTEVLQTAGIRVHVWNEDALPTPEQAARQLRGEDVFTDDNARGPIPVADVQELLSEGDYRDYNHDPVASSFFDDLDAMVPAKT